MENEEGKPNAHGQRADIGLKLTVSGITLKSQSSPNSRGVLSMSNQGVFITGLLLACGAMGKHVIISCQRTERPSCVFRAESERPSLFPFAFPLF